MVQKMKDEVEERDINIRRIHSGSVSGDGPSSPDWA